MSTEIIIVIICLVLMAIILPGTLRNQKKTNKAARNYLDFVSTDFDKLKSDIQKYDQYVLKANSASNDGTLNELYNRSKKKCDELRKSYLTSNGILTAVDTCSGIGLCGISNTDFWYELGWKNTIFSPDTYFQKYSDWEIYSQIEKLMEKAENNVGKIVQVNYSDIARENIADLRQRFNFYRQIEKSEIKFGGKHIPLSNILCFKVTGTTQYVSEISGGGVNARGAVAGAIIGGGAAAIIGSQIGTETKTNIVKKDDRKLIISYYENNELRVMNVETAHIDTTIEALRKLIPAKEETAVLINQTVANNISPYTSNSNADELKKFKELLDSGIITQEEFDAKKKQILGL